MASLIVLVPLLVTSVATGTAAAILAWRRRPEPGATPLVGLLVGQTWWSICIIFKLRADTMGPKLLWTDLAWAGVVVIPVAWLLFALEYTGRDHYVTPQFVAALAVVPAATVVLALTDQYHDLLYVRSVAVDSQGIVELTQGGLWFWVIAGYTYLLGVFGMVPLLGLLTSDAVTFRGQGAALLVGLLVPWLTNALHLAGALPTSGIDPTPVAFSISGVAFLGAVSRFQLLGTSPAPNERAPQFVFDGMQEGAIVVDANDYVVDVNESALDLLGVDARSILGAPAVDVLPEYDRLPAEGALDGHLTVETGAGSRPYDVRVTGIQNVRGTTIGRVITLHDVGRYVRQQQRLEVLNRLLRHNIRNETTIINGYADEFPEDEAARRVKEHASRISELGRKGREAIEVFESAREGARSLSLDAHLRSCVASVREDHPAVTVSYDPPAEEVAVSGMLAPVFTNLIENAFQHADEASDVDVAAAVSGDRVRVEVADDGPGIEPYEVAVLESGTETALRHGSGLGLWIVKWGIDVAGGEVTFEENDPTGTVVTVEVPVLDGGPDPDDGAPVRGRSPEPDSA